MATVAQIQEHYDSLAFIYRTYWGDHIHHGFFETGDESAEEAQIKMLDYCAGLLNLQGGEEVLDAGCGHGGTLLHLAGTRACRGTGVTLSPKQAKLARENAAKAKLNQKLKFIAKNIADHSFLVFSCDLVWAMESTEHFPDKPRFFGNVATALRPGGQLLLAAWTGSMDKFRVREVARAFLCPALWTPEQYCGVIESSGMQVRHCEDLTSKVIRTWEICRQHARLAAPVVRLLPAAAREFVEGIDIILDAYRSGDLSYTVLTAHK